jgi:hypothetical protein
MRRLLVLVVLAVLSSTAVADTIAMLPLDGETRLEIYGQPVAAEIARALKAAGLDVVVVGARMDVPDRAQLIVDGTIKATKTKQIELSIRVRDPRDGTVLETLPQPASKLDELDKAAAELSARVVPSVKHQLEVIAKPAVVEKPVTEKPVAQPPKPQLPALATEVKTVRDTKLVPLATALRQEASTWAAPQHVAASVTFEVLGYTPQKGDVPVARARVKVVIKRGDEKKLDRIVRTDTIVGERNGSLDELAARTAREVLAIVTPNLRRALRN